jgi:hypothetical protein
VRSLPATACCRWYPYSYAVDVPSSAISLVYCTAGVHHDEPRLCRQDRAARQLEGTQNCSVLSCMPLPACTKLRCMPLASLQSTLCSSLTRTMLTHISVLCDAEHTDVLCLLRHNRRRSSAPAA